MSGSPNRANCGTRWNYDGTAHVGHGRRGFKHGGIRRRSRVGAQQKRRRRHLL